MKFLTKAWIQTQLSSFAERISNVFARKTDIEAHCTQKATQSILGHVKLSDSAAITTPGEYALDAVEKNASVQGTLAYLIQQTNSNLTNVSNRITSANLIPYWVDTPNGLSVYYYENNDTTEFNIPSPFVVILVIKVLYNRGIALAADWRYDQNRQLYVNALHDTWRGWIEK